MPGDNRDSVDARIDSALHSYAEPPAAVRDPNIAAAALLDRARRARVRRSFWMWAIPVAACLLALVGLTVWMLRDRQVPQLASAVSPTPTITAPAPRNAPVRAADRSRSRARPLPKLDVFPTPAPLSTQEQALVAFARHAPPAVKQAVIDDQRDWDRPHAVAGLNISPPGKSGIPKSESEEPEKENR
jgi:hypothetical protein